MGFCAGVPCLEDPLAYQNVCLLFLSVEQPFIVHFICVNLFMQGRMPPNDIPLLWYPTLLKCLYIAIVL